MSPIRNKQRARTSAEKDLRRQDLLDAAARALQESTYESATMSAIAASAGIAKPSAYGYFRGKECMFIALAERELMSWAAHFARQLERSRARDPARVIARAVATTLAQQPLLTNLLPLSHAFLESGLTPQEIRDHKRFYLNLLAAASMAIHRRVPQIDPDEAVRLLMLTYALILGLGQLANPAPVVRKVIASDPDLAVFAINFETTLEATLEQLVRGSLTARD